MKNEVVEKQKEMAFELVASIRKDMDDIKTHFFSIGVALNKISIRMLYYDLGYPSIAECAEALFDIKKSTCYDLMRVAQFCADQRDRNVLASSYQKFNQSQLVAITSTRYSMHGFANLVKPEDPVSLVKKARRYWDQMQGGGMPWSRRNTLTQRGFSDIQDFVSVFEEVMNISDSKRLEKPVVIEVVPDPIITDYSERPENIEAASPDVDSERSENADVGEAAEGSYWDKPLREFLMTSCEKTYRHMDYKTIFDPDNKGMGVRVEADHLAHVMVEAMLEAFENDKTVLKRKFQEFFECRLGKFDYTFTLCGNKQGLKPFCGNLASFVVDFFMAEHIAMQGSKTSSKKKK